MKRHVFRRVFILHTAILLFSVIFVEFYITSVVRDNYLTTLKSSLSVQAGLISADAALLARSNLDKLCRQLKHKTGARVTVIDAQGKVLGDSDSASRSMDNHADRPEIQKSLRTETGWSIRHSDTLEYDLLYVAHTIVKDRNVQGFVRLALPLQDVNRSINALRLKINLVVILLFLISAAVLIWQTEKIRSFVMQIGDFAGALAHGIFKKRLYMEGAGEFTELAKNLNNMASELEESIKQRDEETNRLSVVLKSIPDALLLINMSGFIELANDAAREVFSHHKLEDKHFMEAVRNPEFGTLIEEVRNTRVPGSAELIINMPEEMFMTVRVSPLSYRVGKLAGLVAIFHDTTRMKKLEQMRKDFVANVSHEIKTPITSIKGFSETLLDGALYDKENAEKFLRTIKTHSERLNRLVEDLLTISRLELGVMSIAKSEFNIADTIDNVIQATVIQAAEKNITVKKSLEGGEQSIIADRDRVEQILLNLIDNAIKFTEKGTIETGITRDNGRNCFFVRDTGIGIPPKYLSRLGERFFRVDPSRSRELGGTGLGLAIVKHIVKAHGWEMKIESKEGKGTLVKVYY